MKNYEHILKFDKSCYRNKSRFYVFYSISKTLVGPKLPVYLMSTLICGIFSKHDRRTNYTIKKFLFQIQ